jgi:hypothetical protein
MNDAYWFGKVAKCQHGKIGVIHTKKKHTTIDGYDYIMYYGVSLDGSKWQSQRPEILANNLEEFIESAIRASNVGQWTLAQ